MLELTGKGKQMLKCKGDKKEEHLMHGRKYVLLPLVNLGYLEYMILLMAKINHNDDNNAKSWQIFGGNKFEKEEYKICSRLIHFVRSRKITIFEI